MNIKNVQTKLPYARSAQAENVSNTCQDFITMIVRRVLDMLLNMIIPFGKLESAGQSMGPSSGNLVVIGSSVVKG